MQRYALRDDQWKKIEDFLPGREGHVGGTAADIGYVTAVQTVTRLVFVLVGGVWADRLRRHLVMLGSDVVRAAVQAGLAVLLISGHCLVWELGLGACVFGAAQAFFGPACAGLVPQTVPAEHLRQGNALIGLAASFLEVAGPATAGLLVAAFGPGLVFAVDSATYVVSAVSLSLLRLSRQSMPERGSFRADLAAGWREIALRRWYWLSLIAHALWNFAIPAYLVLGPVIAARMLGGASAWGVIAAAWAAGEAAGGIVALRARPGRPLVAANLALVLTALPLLALAWPLATWSIGVAAAVSGGGLAFLSVTWATTTQQLIPGQVLSRVVSYDWLISLLAMPAGFAIVGPLAAEFGDPLVLVWASVLLAVPALMIALLPAVRGVRRTADGGVAGSERRDVGRALAT